MSHGEAVLSGMIRNKIIKTFKIVDKKTLTKLLKFIKVITFPIHLKIMAKEV